MVGQFLDFTTIPDLGVSAQLAEEPWRVPVGIRESDLETAFLEAYDGEHILVAGPARSGKSTFLLALRDALLAGAESDGEPLTIWGLCGRRSPLNTAGLDRCANEDEMAAMLASARVHSGRLVLMVDDAETFADSDQSLTGLLSTKLPNLHMVAPGVPMTFGRSTDTGRTWSASRVAGSGCSPMWTMTTT